MCCSGSEFKKNEIDGKCPCCGEPTVDGEAYECCSYSPTECQTCGYAPCDQSC